MRATKFVLGSGRYGLQLAVVLSSVAALVSASAQTEGRVAVGGHFAVGFGGGGAAILGAACFQRAVGVDVGGLENNPNSSPGGPRPHQGLISRRRTFEVEAGAAMVAAPVWFSGRPASAANGRPTG